MPKQFPRSTPRRKQYSIVTTKPLPGIPINTRGTLLAQSDWYKVRNPKSGYGIVEFGDFPHSIVRVLDGDQFRVLEPLPCRDR